MADPPSRRRRRAGLWALALCLMAAALVLAAPGWLRAWQERAIDALVQAGPGPGASAVTVIDIGRHDEAGNPWSRAASARLAARLAEAGPAVIGWDIVFAGGCGPEAANLALASALGRAPAVLGFLMSREAVPPPGPPPVLALAEGVALWSAPGAEAPCPGFVTEATTLAALSLPGDAQALVRRVPAAVGIGGGVWPSLALEVVRRALALPVPLVAGSLHLGERVLPLDDAAMLRFRPLPADAHAARTLPAAAVLARALAPGALAGRIVLVGSSLPQSGGLRPTAADPLTPSVQIAADLIDGILAGPLPWRPAPWPEAAALALAGLLLALALPRLAPLPALGLVGALALLWVLAALALHRLDGRLIDPVFPPLLMSLAALAALLAQAAATARAEAALRRRMGQLLPPAVVARLADQPGLLRLSGERRLVTALFTDLEGFSAATNTLPPEALIATLDRYFAVLNAQVLAQGGMVDKIVGDGMHALFNAPLDQPGHAEAALRAAAAIVQATEALRRDLPGLGRTRIGIETGPAILGDVGGGDGAGRIDYTAHGPAVNLAARLQEAGKVLGPAVIIGPGAAAAAQTRLHPLGLHPIRGFGEVALFTLPPCSPGN